MNDLIKIEQLPIITERLEARGLEIKQKIGEALSMVCTDDTVKIIKVVRAELTKEFKLLEEQRKQVKNAVMAPYDAFEAVYKANVTNLFKPADDQLKAKIDDVEDTIKAVKAADVREYFDGYLAGFPAIDFLTFERVGLNITKSANSEALKKQCFDFINKVSDELDMIAELPDQAEVLVEYIPTLNAAQAITTVAAKRRAIEAQKAAIEAQKIVRIPEPIPEPIPGPIPEPVAEPAKIVWVQYKNDQGDFAGVKYSYLLPESGDYFIDQILEVDTKKGKATVRISDYGTIDEVPAHILPYLKYLPEPKPIDDFAIPDFSTDDFEFPTHETKEPAGKATYRIAIVDTVERIDALQEILKSLEYYFYEI